MILPKININKIYFNNMTLLEYVTKLFRNNDNFELIESLIICGCNINKPFIDGSFFFQNFIDSSTRMTISKVTALNDLAFELYKNEKMDKFYEIYFNYGINNIDQIVFDLYIPYLLKYDINISFKKIQYLMPENKFIFARLKN